ncbi:MAG: hypothetical protein K2X91_02915, partial [Thermoleophilia bacterium]|nr:hypothetical protein [Thermoleophilia bacterium]
MVNDPAAAALVVGGTRDAKTYEVHASTIADAPRPGSQTPDPRWYWLTGSPFPPRWVELDAGVPAKDPRRAGAFDIRWTEPLSLAEFNAARAVDGKGKPLPVGDDRASRLWLDSAERGWVALSRAALVIIDAVPADQRAGLFDFLETATRTPGDHWRAALLRRAIRPATPAKPDFEPAALNTLALQLGEQWAAAIGR